MTIQSSNKMSANDFSSSYQLIRKMKYHWLFIPKIIPSYTRKYEQIKAPIPLWNRSK